jgi:hypothetical protein
MPYGLNFRTLRVLLMTVEKTLFPTQFLKPPFILNLNHRKCLQRCQTTCKIYNGGTHVKLVNLANFAWQLNLQSLQRGWGLLRKEPINELAFFANFTELRAMYYLCKPGKSLVSIVKIMRISAELILFRTENPEIVTFLMKLTIYSSRSH